MSETYSVVMTGEVIEGFDLESVQEAFAKLFKLSQEKVQGYFAGKPKVLKKAVDHATASKYKARMEKVGVSVELVAATKTKKSAQPATQPAEQRSLESQAPTHKSIKTLTDNLASPASRLKEIAQEQANFTDPSINAIEAARLKKERKMQRIEIEAASSNRLFMVLSILCVIFAAADFGLAYLNIFILTGTLWAPIVSALIGLVLFKASRAT
jgi:hypothetical protein